MANDSNPEAPGLAKYLNLSFALYLLASIILLGGAVFCFALWPEKASFGYGWRPIAYLPPTGALAFGIMQGAFFAALGKGLHYLRRIADNTTQSE